MTQINVSNFGFSQICAAACSGGKNFGPAVNEYIGNQMSVVRRTSLGALHQLNIQDAEHAVAGSGLGAVSTAKGALLS